MRGGRDELVLQQVDLPELFQRGDQFAVPERQVFLVLGQGFGKIEDRPGKKEKGDNGKDRPVDHQDQQLMRRDRETWPVGREDAEISQDQQAKIKESRNGKKNVRKSRNKKEVIKKKKQK